MNPTSVTASSQGTNTHAIRGSEILLKVDVVDQLTVAEAAVTATATAATPDAVPTKTGTVANPAGQTATTRWIASDRTMGRLDPKLVLDCAGADLSLAEELFPLPVGDQLVHVARFPADAPAPDGYAWMPLRHAIRTMPDAGWYPAARAMSHANWRATTRYCGRCGAPNNDKPDELARCCSACGALSFPRISPAILAVVSKDGRLLLARNAMNRQGFWSLVAGFVEQGETFEDCVHREVMEEVGIKVSVDGYLGSQPWPFPDQLMLGFAAHWTSGELRPDGHEIAEAGWFGPDGLPPIPGPGSLSRRLIDGFFSGTGLAD